jgi:hypothetical protein
VAAGSRLRAKGGWAAHTRVSLVAQVHVRSVDVNLGPLSDARSSITSSRRGRAFRRFAFLGLAVMTQSYILHRHDDMFHVEH